jgi:hypothetical protein
MAHHFQLDASDFTGYKVESQLAAHMASNRREYGQIRLTMATHVATSRVEYTITVGGEVMGTLTNFYNAVDLFNKVESFLNRDDIIGLKAIIADKASLEPRVQVAV